MKIQVRTIWDNDQRFETTVFSVDGGFFAIEHVKRIEYITDPETGTQTAKIVKAKIPENISVTLSPVIEAEIIEE